MLTLLTNFLHDIKFENFIHQILNIIIIAHRYKEENYILNKIQFKNTRGYKNDIMKYDIISLTLLFEFFFTEIWHHIALLRCLLATFQINGNH